MYLGRVIYYHHVAAVPRPDHWSFRLAPSFGKLRSDMEYLKSACKPISIEQLVDYWDGGMSVPSGAVVVTFDDGMQSNYEAARILRDMSIPACFFVSTSTIDTDFVPWNLRFAHIMSTAKTSQVEFGGCSVELDGSFAQRRWELRTRRRISLLAPKVRDDELEALAEVLHAGLSPVDDADSRFLTSEQLRNMQEWGMTIACHGATHENLRRCTPQELNYEMVQSKEHLAGVLDRPVEFFAYPDGLYNQAARDLAANHYRMAFSAPINVGSRHDRWSYPRWGVDGMPIRQALAWWRPWRLRAARVARRALGLA